MQPGDSSRTLSSPPRADIEVRLASIGDLATLERDWHELEARGRPSFFQSWGWIGCWLRHLPEDLRVSRLEARAPEGLVGLGLIVESTERRRGMIVSRAAHLHESGRKAFDLAIEHNGFLLDRRRETDARRACLRFLAAEIRPGRWDEVVLSEVAPEYESELRAAAAPAVLVARPRPMPCVDLARLRASGTPYPSALSRNTRRQLRRSRRYFSERGAMALRVASSEAEAHEFFTRMTALHERRWRARGGSAFAPELVQRFHRDLLGTRFRAGEIQLIRVTAGSDAVGYLYNFVHAERVSFFQSGLAFEDTAACRPGLVCHALAIEHNLARGADVYDFLSGEARYKYSLSTDVEQSSSLALQKDRLDFRIENALRRLKERVVRGDRSVARAVARLARRARAAATNGTAR